MNTNTETCDDTNLDDTDNCTNACQLAVYGDGIHANQEECDDGNEDNTDGCTTEGLQLCGDGYVKARRQDDGNALTTMAAYPTVRLLCGDGLINVGTELCDDGNMIDNDGRRNDCIPGTCGDGIVQEGEQCDDGNEEDNDDSPQLLLRHVWGWHRSEGR